jgi:hypothetical protein
VNVSRPIVIGLGILLTAWQSGCGQREKISHYTVPKEQAASPQGIAEIPADQATDRMLAAIIPFGDQAWFFKLTGPKDVVAPVANVFRTFVESVRFSGGNAAKPTWTLPTGWQEQPGSQFRFATIVVPSQGQPLDLSVSALPMPPTDETGYILLNINRWRGQLGQAPISASQMATHVQVFDVAGVKATLVDFVGKAGSSDMGQAPFAGGGPALPGPSAPIASPPPSTGQGSSGLTYETPKGWTTSAGSSMSLVAFQVRDGGQLVETTVTTAGGDLLPNINRWRGQIQLGPMTQEQLQADAKKIPVGDVTGDYIELVGPADANPSEAILGVVAVRDGTTWFIKLKGDAPLAEREKQNFEAFVKSIKFSNADGANHGK